MSEAEFIGMLILALVVIVGFIVSIITPMLKLNTNIVKLNDTIERMLADGVRRDHRLDKHGEEIDGLKETVTRHEYEIGTLKERQDL